MNYAVFLTKEFTKENPWFKVITEPDEDANRIGVVDKVEIGQVFVTISGTLKSGSAFSHILPVTAITAILGRGDRTLPIGFQAG